MFQFMDYQKSLVVKKSRGGRQLKIRIITTVVLILTLGLPTAAVAADPPSANDVTNAIRYDTDGSLLGTPLVFGNNDDANVRVNLDPSFPINFFGNKYESFCVDINGVVHFRTPSCGSSYYNRSTQALATVYQAPVISALAADLAIPVDVANAPWSWGSDGNSGVYFYSTADTVVITWFRVTTYVYSDIWDTNPRPGDPVEVLTFQFVAEKRDTGSITDGFDFDWEWNYGTVQSPRSGYGFSSCELNDCFWGIGWANYDGTAGSEVFNLLGEKRRSELVDGGSSALVSNRLNTLVDGRYRLAMIGGEPVTVLNDYEEDGSTNNSSGQTSSPTLAATGSQGYWYLVPGLFLTFAGISIYSGSVAARRKQS
jgi:hypothetical protein